MKDILIKNNVDTIWEAFGIAPKRAKKLQHRMDLAIHNLFTPTEDGLIRWRDIDIVKLFLALAETDEERVVLSYFAGIHCVEIAQRYDNCNPEMYEDDDEF